MDETAVPPVEVSLEAFGVPPEAFGPVMGIMMGIGLSAAAGFRVFVPFLVMGVCAKSGYMTIPEDYAWIVSWPAIIAFGSATLFEVGAYYVPWVDNMMDTVATPAAVVAGVIATYVAAGELHPMLQWGTAIIGGGGIAGTVQLGTVLTRGLSTATTGGLGNPIVSTVEAGGSIATASLAIFIAPLAFIIVLAISIYFLRKLFGRKKEVHAVPAG